MSFLEAQRASTTIRNEPHAGWSSCSFQLIHIPDPSVVNNPPRRIKADRLVEMDGYGSSFKNSLPRPAACFGIGHADSDAAQDECHARQQRQRYRLGEGQRGDDNADNGNAEQP